MSPEHGEPLAVQVPADQQCQLLSVYGLRAALKTFHNCRAPHRVNVTMLETHTSQTFIMVPTGQLSIVIRTSARGVRMPSTLQVVTMPPTIHAGQVGLPPATDEISRSIECLLRFYSGFVKTQEFGNFQGIYR